MDTTVETAVSWMVNGSVVDTSQDGRISTDGDTLTFSPLTTSDTGSYTCTLTITLYPQAPHVTVQSPVQSRMAVGSKNTPACFNFVMTVYSLMYLSPP